MPMAILTPTTMGRGECWNPRPSSWGHSPHRSLGRCRDAARGEGCPQKCRSGRSYSNSYSYSRRWLGVLGGDRGSSPSTALRAEYEYEYGGAGSAREDTRPTGVDVLRGTLAPPAGLETENLNLGTCPSGAPEFAHGLDPIVDEELRSAGEIRERDLVHVDSQRLIERGVDLAELHRSAGGLTAEAVR